MQEKGGKDSDKLLSSKENVSYKVHAFFCVCGSLYVIA